eukprot:768438-Hanusia_phi.AAC.1
MRRREERWERSQVLVVVMIWMWQVDLDNVKRRWRKGRGTGELKAPQHQLHTPDHRAARASRRLMPYNSPKK